LRVIQPVLDLFARVLYLVFVAIVYILFLVLEPLINFIRNLPRDTNQLPQPIEMPDLQRQLEEASRGQAAIPAWVSSLSHALLILGALMIVILLFALAFRQFYGYKEDGIEEDREFIGSWDLLRAQLADLLARLQPKPGRAAGQPFLPLEGEDGRRIIRQMYQTLLAAASRAGYKRAPEQTPIEYLDTLAQWKPDCNLPLHILTDAYDEARYSQAPISGVQLNVAQQAWRTLQRLLTGARLYDETTNGHAPQEMCIVDPNVKTTKRRK
ncbi:MAG: DUF4129 domain-containing protein, partial [Anaerolineae bacterium]|nr:DUF4129 domain-containing protein [Anaerolineae bacterium]